MFEAPTQQNRSTAVMQRRAVTDDDLDYYPTQPWAVRALAEWLRDNVDPHLARRTCWEPACGAMHMADALSEYFASVRASDIARYDERHELLDFLEYAVWASRDAVDWVITNPPFVEASRFIKRARRLGKRGVVMFVRSAFTEGAERYRSLFSGENAPSYIVDYSERVVLLRGRLIRTGRPDPFNWNPTTFELPRATSATAYSLVIWLPGQHDTRHRWIGPCREQLERDSDYPAYEEQWEVYRAARALATGQEELQL